MARRTKPLSDIEIRKQKPQAKTVKLFDGGGLYLEIRPTGGNRWRLKYRIGGREKVISLGTYPATSLNEAREQRALLKKMVADGIDPAQAQRLEQEHNRLTFEAVAAEWHQKQAPTWTEAHATLVKNRLETYIHPSIGNKPLADIKPADLLPPLRHVEALGYQETARKIRGYLSQIFRYGVACDYCESDPASLLLGAMKPTNRGHRAAITDPAGFAQLLRAIDGYIGTATVRAALRLAPLLFQRPGELRRMEWGEVDLDAGLWSLPPEKMKTRQAHIVPLSKQAVAILKELHPLTGNGQWVFCQIRKPEKPISENALSVALKAIGYDGDQHTAHGFRASARTLLDETLHVQPWLIEHQLAHAVKDANGRSYNRTSHLKDRKQMMQQWADYCDRLRKEDNVVQFPVSVATS